VPFFALGAVLVIRWRAPRQNGVGPIRGTSCAPWAPPKAPNSSRSCVPLGLFVPAVVVDIWRIANAVRGRNDSEDHASIRTGISRLASAPRSWDWAEQPGETTQPVPRFT
jgi:hypothetical protein